MLVAPSRPAFEIPEKIRSLLAGRGLSLADVARASRTQFPENRLHHIPHNFYSFLRRRRFSPSLFQMLTLSVLSGYRLVDWLSIFGFSLDDVPRLQASFPALRTVELDARVYQLRASIPWFSDVKEANLSASLIPLSQWLAPAAPRRLDSVDDASEPAYRYVKIGSHDAFAFPDLLPGSIVRVARRGVESFRRVPVGKTPARHLFLVEHSGGLTCSRLYRSGANKIVLCSRQLPYAPVELKYGTEGVVCGVADLEIRPLANPPKPVVPTGLGRFWTPLALRRTSRADHAGEFIRRARKRSGLSFREASERTRVIARELGDSRYYCAAASLSDCETRKLPPRHIHKLISICAVYFASAANLLEACGASLGKAGKLPMPCEFIGLPPSQAQPPSKGSHFLELMQRRFRQFPYFLHRAVATVFNLPDISIRDIFWAGGSRGSLRPCLSGAAFLIVDRKQKVPRPSLSCPAWAQPVYVLQLREGAYMYGFCSLQNDMLIVRPCVAAMPKLIRLRNRVDAEIVGKVVGIARHLA